jgi:3-oxoacyl-ACP reductase-like protein
MSTNRIVTGVAALVAAAGLIGTGAALSNAATTTPTSTSTAAASPNASGNANNDTPVTGTELTKVTAAVKAKDSAVAVTSVRMDPDGSYDVFGTKSGANVMLEVSKDLKSITTNAGGQHG